MNHQGLSAASTVSFNLPTGSSLSEASDAINRAMTQLRVPSSVRGNCRYGAGVPGHHELAGHFDLAAIATVYIVLGVLYESYVHPLTILSASLCGRGGAAGAGAVQCVQLIALIGIMLLIGIVKKNAMLMVDFALDAQHVTAT